MAKMIKRERRIRGEYSECKKCGHIQTNTPECILPMPYCSECGMVVFDAGQKYCAFCGGKFEVEK